MIWSSNKKQVNVSTLKAKLSSYLLLVKQGADIVILDRNLPVAKIIGIEKSGNPNDFSVIEPIDQTTSLRNIKGKKLSTGKKTDVVALLMEDRMSR